MQEKKRGALEGQGFVGKAQATEKQSNNIYRVFKL